MGAVSRYNKSRASKRKPPKRRISIDKEKNKEEIPACSTSQTEVSAASLSASAHKIKNNLVENNIEMPRESYFMVNSQLLTDLLSVIGKCPTNFTSNLVLFWKAELLSWWLSHCLPSLFTFIVYLKMPSFHWCQSFVIKKTRTFTFLEYSLH